MDIVTSYSTITPTYMTKWRQTTHSVSLATQMLKAVVKSTGHKDSTDTKCEAPRLCLTALLPGDLAWNIQINPKEKDSHPR